MWKTASDFCAVLCKEPTVWNGSETFSPDICGVFLHTSGPRSRRGEAARFLRWSRPFARTSPLTASPSEDLINAGLSGSFLNRPAPGNSTCSFLIHLQRGSTFSFLFSQFLKRKENWYQRNEQTFYHFGQERRQKAPLRSPINSHSKQKPTQSRALMVLQGLLGRRKDHKQDSDVGCVKSVIYGSLNSEPGFTLRSAFPWNEASFIV